MKKLILLLLISIVFVYAGYSQVFGGGFLAGLSASQLEGDSWKGYNKAGLTFGVYTNVVLNQYVDAQLELRYVQKGSNSNSDDIAEFYVSKLNYIELPVFLKYSFLNDFTANIGVAFGYLQKGVEDFGLGEEKPYIPFEQYEFSGLIGVEYHIINRFYASARFNYSILPIRPHPNEKTYYLDKGQYNNVLTFAVYYQISNPDARSKKKACDCPKWRERKYKH